MRWASAESMITPDLATGALVAVRNAGHTLGIGEVLAREPERGPPRRVLLQMPHRQVWWTRRGDGLWQAEGCKTADELVPVTNNGGPIRGGLGQAL